MEASEGSDLVDTEKDEPKAAEQIVHDEFCPDTVFCDDSSKVVSEENDDKNNKLVGKVLISPVSKNLIQKDIVEKNVRELFEAIGVKVLV